MIAYHLRKSGPQHLSVSELSCRDPVRLDKVSLTLGHWMERPEERGKYTVYGQQKADKLASHPDMMGNAIQDQRTSSSEPELKGSHSWKCGQGVGKACSLRVQKFPSLCCGRQSNQQSSFLIIILSGAGIASQTNRKLDHAASLSTELES